MKSKHLLLTLLAVFMPWAMIAQTVVGNSWSDNFEGETCGWTLTNGTATNVWAWGTAVSNGGTHALYVSNDNGTTNAYTNNKMGVVYASKLFTFAEGKFQISFDWKANGESNYDYMRVWLVPATETLPNAGYMPNGNALTSYSQLSGYTSTTPTNWIDLGVGKLNQKTDWQTGGTTISQLAAGDYYILFMWGNDTSGGDNPPAVVDNVSITRIACPYEVTGLAVTPSSITTSGATITWTAGEATQWQVAYAITNDFASATEEIVSAATYPMAGLTDGTHYYVRVRAYCGGSDYGAWSNVVEFDTKCLATTVPNEGWTENFDGLTVASAYTAPAARVLPICWSAINTSTYSTYKVFPTVYYYSSTNYANSTPNCLKFYSSYSQYSSYDPQPQYAILPEMDNLDGMRIKLWARGYNATSTFKIGRMTDPEDASTFVPFTIGEGNEQALTTSYQEFTYNLTGTGNYIAIMINAANSSNNTIGVYIDDIRVEEIPSCTEPSGLECTATTANTATLGWTAGGTEAAWDIYVSTTNTAPTNSTTPTVSATTDNPATVPDLTAATTYFAWVRAHCSDSDQSPWIGGISFTTDCETVTTFPFVQNFNSLTNNSEIPVCWDNNDGSTFSYEYYKWCYYDGTGNGGTTGTGHNNTNCVRFNSYTPSNGLYNCLKTPVMNLPEGKTMQLTFWYKNPSGGDFSVYISTDGGSTYTTSLATGLTGKSSWTEREIVLSDYVGTENVVIVFKGTSNCGYGDAYIYLDDVTIAEAPTCIKPSALACDSKTAHTATLSWTNGAEGQNAWQIAYSTTADFDPNNVTPVDVTTNPATIEGLAQSTTYYAYVRAYCGGTDYSAWCNNKVTFTTLAGNVTPTGLAVEGSTITSSQATASWNAVAGNDLHEYYQIYWAEATVTSVPDEPAAPNLITNITATSQLISGLNPETSYKVWVRDICGTDGNSAWSSYVTFTTAASCQLPDGLAESEVTATSAKISWNTYGLTNFNLRYGTDGENWTTLTNVNSPCLLDGVLTANTAYQVQVQATCNTEAWSTVLNFRTECDAITITDSDTYTEDFEAPVTTAEYSTTTLANLLMPYCWDNYTNSTSGYAYAIPHLIKSTAGSNGYNYSSPASQVLYFYGDGDGYAALPEFTNDLNTLQISFKWATEGSTQGTLTLGYITAEDNGTYNTFTPIGESFNASSASYHQMKSETVYLDAVPATATRLVFRWSYSSWYGANIDDIEVSLLPSCYPVGTLSAATDVTYNSAKLSWTLVDNTQTEWTVQYATNAGFTEDVANKTATTNTNYELTGLTSETHYWVRVKAACSETDDWSNAIDFETEVFCVVSVPAAANITQTTADLSWTGSSDSYNIQYRTAAYATTNQLLFQGFEGYTDEADFEASSGWTVLDLGDGSNTDELGIHTDAKKTDDYGFRFSSMDVNDWENYTADDFDQYLISPELTNTGILEFAYKSSNGTQDKFRVGYSSTTNDISAFTWGAETNSASSWKTYSETMPEDAKYFAINYTAVYQYYLYIDDITIYELQPAGAWQDATSDTESKQLTGLEAGKKYEVKVQGVCDGTPGNWSESISFTTLPFTKTIEAYDTDNEKGWYLIASPLADAVNLDDVDGLTNETFRLYSFNQGADLEWQYYAGTNNPFSSLVNGKGYLYANTNDVTLTFTGVPYNGEGDVTLSLTEGAEFAGWNLVGNPFAEDAYIEKSFYRMNDDRTGLIAEPITGAIHAMEGVFVIADQDGETLTFTTIEPSKGANLTLNVGRNRGNVIDRAIVNFGEGGTLPKFQLFENSTKVYIPQDNKDYAVVNAEAAGEMPVNFKAEENGIYSLNFNAEEVSFSYLHLIDNMTGNDIDLLQTPSYTFNATTTDYESRFKLVFCTGVNDNSDSFAFCSNGNWIISNEGQATLQVIDITGRILSSETVNGSVSKSINAAPGVYMIRLINGDNVKVQKIVVR